MINIEIRDMAVVHGEEVVDNEYYINYFKDRGKDVEHFLSNVIGRDKRYMMDREKQSGLTMSIDASRAVMEKNSLKGEDLDMIIYSSILPEYFMPPSAIHVHQALGGKKEAICYDMNANCAGMTVLLDNICKYMHMTEGADRALIVGMDHINMILNPENELCHGHYGDAACAVILEKTEKDCGVLGTKIRVNNEEYMNILCPGCGSSNIYKTEDRSKWLIDWKPFENVNLPTAVESMNALLQENNLTKEDIAMFCFSQYAYTNVETLREMLDIPEEQSLFIGDQYGYTGTSSPFIVLYESVKKGLVKRGDYVMFWTIGAGSENIALLYKY